MKILKKVQPAKKNRSFLVDTPTLIRVSVEQEGEVIPLEGNQRKEGYAQVLPI